MRIFFDAGEIVDASWHHSALARNERRAAHAVEMTGASAGLGDFAPPLSAAITGGEYPVTIITRARRVRHEERGTSDEVLAMKKD